MDAHIREYWGELPRGELREGLSSQIVPPAGQNKARQEPEVPQEWAAEVTMRSPDWGPQSWRSLDTVLGEPLSMTRMNGNG